MTSNGETKLSLKTRMNLRDFSSDHVLQQIQEVLEITPCLQLDMTEFVAAVDQTNYESRAGEVLLWLLESLLKNIKRVVAVHDVCKWSLQGAWNTGNIKWREEAELPAACKRKQTVIFEDGVLVIVSQRGHVGSDIKWLGRDLESVLIWGELTLQAQLNVFSKQDANNEKLLLLQTLLDCGDLRLDIDMGKLSSSLSSSSYVDRPGDVLSYLLNNLYTNLTRLVARSSLAREALQSSFTTGVIRWRLDEYADAPQQVVFEDGHMCVVSKDASCGWKYVGVKIESQLKCGKLSLKAAQNVDDSKEKRELLLTRIQEAAGLPSIVSLDVDWEVLAAHSAESGYPDRAGDVVTWILEGLCGHLEKLSGDELVKEALQEAWTSGRINHEQDELGWSGSIYHRVAFKHGNLVHVSRHGRIGKNAKRQFGSKIIDIL